MSAGLHDELDRLARQVPVGPPPGDLWQRGARRRRARRVRAGAAVLLALVLAVLLPVAIREARDVASPPVASGGRAAHLPSRLEVPGPWTAGTEQAGPPGRVAALFDAPRKSGWLGRSETGVVAVSAGTGRYVFLDLPGEARGLDLLVNEQDGPVLSPDGRTVAYWVRGTAPDGTTAVTAVGAYDTATGRVRRRTLQSGPHGLVGGRIQWIGSRSTMLQVGPKDEAGGLAAEADTTYVWSPAGRLSRLSRASGSWIDAEQAPGDGLWVRHHTLVSNIFDELPERVAGPRSRILTSGLSPSGRLAVTTASGTWWQGQRGSAGQPVRLREIRLGYDGTDGYRLTRLRVIGWRSEEQVVLQGRMLGADPIASRGVWLVDLPGGHVTRLVTLTPDVGPATFAAELWGASVVEGQDPPRPWDPRAEVVIGSGLVAVVALVVYALLDRLGALKRRRRVRV